MAKKSKKPSALGAAIKAFFGLVFLAGIKEYEEIGPLILTLVLGLGLLFWAVWPFVKARKSGNRAAPQKSDGEPWKAAPDDVDYPFTAMRMPGAAALKDFIVLDTETTGFSPRDDKIVEVGALKIRDGVETRFHSLVNPGRRIPKRAKEVHKITDEDVAQAPSFLQLLPALDAFLDQDLPIVGQSVHYDLRMLWWAYHDAGAEISPRKYIDTYRLAKKAFPGRQSYALASLIHDFHLIEGEQAHRAESDVDATLALYRLCCTELKK